jgi:hypothetical protein
MNSNVGSFSCMVRVYVCMCVLPKKSLSKNLLPLVKMAYACNLMYLGG